MVTFHTGHGVLKASGLPFPSPVGNVLSELPTMTHPSWVAPQGMAHHFIEMDEAVSHRMLQSMESQRVRHDQATEQHGSSIFSSHELFLNGPARSVLSQHRCAHPPRAFGGGAQIKDNRDRLPPLHVHAPSSPTPHPPPPTGRQG